VMSREELVQLFDVSGVNRKAAVFDLAKCEWMNQQYLLKLTPEQLAERVEPLLDKAGVRYGSRAALVPVMALVRERLKRLTDAPNWVDYFFTDDVAFDPEAVEKVLRKPGALDKLKAYADACQALGEWTSASLEQALKACATVAGVKAGEFVHPARVAATGRTVGASLYHTLEVLGRERVLARFATALGRFGG
jgi:glutamyl/glutaminyl-tRNA synthetase